MSMELYWISGSAPAWRALLALELKGLSYASKILEAANGDQKAPAFLELNPRGQVPVLTDGSVTVCESSAILMYLERRTPEPALFGETPAKTAAIAQTYQQILDYVDANVTQFVRPIFRNKLEGNEHVVEKHAATLSAEFAVLEEKLCHHAWLEADNMTAADIALIPAFQRFIRALGKSPSAAAMTGLDGFESDFPRLHEWNKVVEALPAFEQTFPPHWR